MSRIFLLIIILRALIFAQPKEEVRAVWLTTAFGLDWPESFHKENQKQEIIKILDLLRDANFNTIMLQVRSRGDLIYPSEKEPWAKSLTNELGKNPGYDPLKFIIREAHKRGLEVHAWWNVFKVYGKGVPSWSKPEHVVLKYPELCKRYRDEWWMDPGIPEARNYLLALVMEMARNYDIDGIHLDFARYPGKDFDDEKTYKKFGEGKYKPDWRRDNITEFVEALYDSIQNVKPMIKLGCTPIGIYKNTKSFSGWEAYTDTYQDPVRWIKDKKLDYISPQTYWKICSPPFYNLVINKWKEITAGRHIYPGIAIFKLNKFEGDWSANEVLTEIDTVRKLHTEGEVFFRTESLVDNEKNILELIKNEKFQYAANIPSMPWKDNVKPLPPAGMTSLQIDKSSFELYWQNPKVSVDGDTAKYLNIYISKKLPVDITNPKNILKFRLPANTNHTLVNLNSFPDDQYFLSVTFIDKGNNESIPSNTTLINLQKGINHLTIAKGQRE